MSEEKKEEKIVVEDVKAEPEEVDEEEEHVAEGETGAAAAAKKKKKKKSKKKKGGAAGAAAARVAVKEQTVPPSIRITELYPNQKYPFGEIVEYSLGNADRERVETAKAAMSFSEAEYEDFREAAVAHRQVRQWARDYIKPGMKMTDIADNIETALRKVTGWKAGEYKRGIAFPTGLSRNNCAAHWTPNAGDTTVLQKGDVLKVDIGVEVNGHIIDSAFTMCFEDKFQPLLDTVREATNAGLRAAGADARLCDVGAAVQEVMDAGEVEINGKVHRIKPVRNLYGHSLGIYQVHTGKSVPIVKGTPEHLKMDVGDVFAIETFGSTGNGFVRDDMETSHYMRSFDPFPMSSVRGGAKAKELLGFINRNYSTLAWARRWLDQAGIQRYALGLKELVDCGAVVPYPPLCDISGSYVAQFEHTVAIKESSKEIFSRGDDY